MRAASRKDATPALAAAASAVTWHRADVASGEGLDDALAGVDVVVHSASDARDSARVDVQGTQVLLDAAARHGVRHFVYISIVGIDAVPLRYYQHKREAERMVEASTIPWTILRGTQFHEFMRMQCEGMTVLPFAVVPRNFRVQPVHVDEYASAVWQVAQGVPQSRAPDVAGPQVLTYAEVLQAWMRARGVAKRMLQVPVPGRIAAAMRRGALTAPDRAVGTLTWADWLVTGRDVS